MEDSRETLSLSMAYNGALFNGFARQPDQLTVQGNLEDALEVLLHRPVETTCAGRTDAGVHARGQVVSFDIETSELDQLRRYPDGNSDPEFSRLRRSLNAITHEDIRITDVQLRKPGFSARFDAKAREYRYFIANTPQPALFMRNFSWHVAHPLDVSAMQRASACLIGEHDFKSFCRASSAEGKPTCRNVMEVAIGTEQVLAEELLVVKVVGSSFLHSMVRTLVGSLVMVGKGLRAESWMAEVLAACDRTAAGETAPAQGLVFWDVRY